MGNYTAPEVVKMRPIGRHLSKQGMLQMGTQHLGVEPPGDADVLSGYGKPADMWSLGVVLYIMLSGIPPFDSEDSDTSLCVQIVEGRWDFDSDIWDRVSPEAKHLVSSLMTLRPRDRLTVQQTLDHEWLRGL